MAKLSEFRSDTRAINDGTWVRVDEALFGDLEILSRGYTDEFLDAQGVRERKAAVEFGGDLARVPNAQRRETNAGLLKDFLVLGVRNLEDDDGSPVTVDKFWDLLAKPEHARLARAAWIAAGKVSAMTAGQLKDAVGNSPTPSEQTSSGVQSASG